MECLLCDDAIALFKHDENLGRCRHGRKIDSGIQRSAGYCPSQDLLMGRKEDLILGAAADSGRLNEYIHALVVVGKTAANSVQGDARCGCIFQIGPLQVR